MKKNYKKQFNELEEDLISKFGRERLEETAFPVYFNRFPFVSYLGWSRIFTAQKLLKEVQGKRVLDFGSGLGVMLPYLAKNYEHVISLDSDSEVTSFVADKLKLNNVEIIKKISQCDLKIKYDAIIALDVLEHVENLKEIYDFFTTITSDNGSWIISGPTENALYKTARLIARTTGEGHVRNIYDVFNDIPSNMKCEKQHVLPWGIPLFLVGKFSKSALD